MIMWTLPRESREWVGPITVTHNGVPSTDSWQLAVTAWDERPEQFADPIELDGGLGVVVGPPDRKLRVGLYRIWVQVTPADETEAPVLRDVGLIEIV